MLTQTMHTMCIWISNMKNLDIPYLGSQILKFEFPNFDLGFFYTLPIYNCVILTTNFFKTN